MKSVPSVWFLLLFVFPSYALAQPPGKAAASTSLAITNVTVIDVASGSAKPEMTVVIAGDRITAIGKTGAFPPPKDAKIVDGKGKFLIPGLWDMHTHISSQEFLSLFIANGVTGVREMGGVLEQSLLWRRMIKEGRLTGPHIVAAGPILDGPQPVWPFSIAVANEAQGRAAVASLKKRGVDFIKVYSLLPRDAYFAIVDEAKKQGLVVAGHVPFSVSALEAIAAGQKSIEHLDMIWLASSSKEEEVSNALRETMSKPGTTITTVMATMQSRAKEIGEGYSEEKSRELLSTMAERGVWLTPTLTVQRAAGLLGDPAFTSDARVKYMPAFIRQSWNPAGDFRFKNLSANEIAGIRAAFAQVLERVGAMHHANVGLLAGTDAPNPYCFPGFGLHDELELMVKAGLTPAEALQTATTNPAKFLGLADLGAIEAGKIADLVLLDGDPLADIANTRKIYAVVANGKLLEKPSLQSLLTQAEAAARQ